METPDNENRTVEPLMRSVEELEQRAYPGETREEIMRDEGRMDVDDPALPGILRGSALPTASGYPTPAPVPGKPVDEIEGDQPSESWRNQR